MTSHAASPSNHSRSSQGKNLPYISFLQWHQASLLILLPGKPSTIGIIGVCALDVKARSKASRNILTRLQSNGEFEVLVFGDKVILDEGQLIPRSLSRPIAASSFSLFRGGKLAHLVSRFKKLFSQLRSHDDSNLSICAFLCFLFETFNMSIPPLVGGSELDTKFDLVIS